MKDAKFELHSNALYGIKKWESHLEEMAEEGWFPEKITALGWHYRKDSPKKRKYTLIFDPKSDGFAAELTEKQLEFRDFLESSGWKPAVAKDELQVFYNDEEDPVSIYTDADTQIRTITKVAKQRFGLYILVFIWLFVFLGMHDIWQSGNLAEKLLDGEFLSSAFALSTLSLYCLVENINFVIWRYRAGKRAEQGELIYPGNKVLIILQPLLWLAAISLLASLFATTLQTQLVIALYLTAVVLIIAAGTALKNQMKKKKVKASKNRRIVLAAVLVLTVVATIIICAAVFKLMCI